MNSPEHKAPIRDKTLRKGLKILEILTLKGAMHLRDVASAGNLTRGNAHHILQSLIEEGFVEQEEQTARYRITLKLWEISTKQLEQHGIVDACKPLMRQLCDQTRESINLAILDENEVLYLHKENSGEGISSFTQIGGRAPAHCVATGKAMLAFDPREEVAWRKLNFTRFNHTTITDFDTFALEMKATRERGYSISFGEWRGDVHACASPILGWAGKVRAAIGISGPSSRMTPERMAEFGVLLCEVTESISEASEKII